MCNAEQTRVGPDRPVDLVWRVRLYETLDHELRVETPAAAGRPFEMPRGTPLTVVMSVGQNRWTFRSGVIHVSPAAPGRPSFLSLAMPDHVERCPRREYARVSTAGLHLPQVECWPLLDPTTVAPAEVANRALILDSLRPGVAPPTSDGLLPEVGPAFPARLMNVGGGGLGLLITRDNAVAAGRSRLLWVRVNLAPHVPAPLAMTIKQVHTHLDSEQNLYVGASFEFAYHPAHRAFVVEQIARFMSLSQPRRAAA